MDDDTLIKKYGSIIKDLIENPQVFQYVIKNPQKILHEKYDSVFENALYGDIYEISMGKEIRLTSLLDFLIKNNISVKIPKVKIPYKSEVHICSITPYENEIYCSLVKAMKAKNIIEIGVFDGKTTTNLASNISEDAVIYAFNLPPDKCDFEVGKYIKQDERAKQIVQMIYADSNNYDFSKYYGKIDVMFIDGDHRYEAVKKDSKNAVKCVRKGGLILWHDFNNTHLGTVKAIYEISQKNNLKTFKIEGTNIAVTINK